MITSRYRVGLFLSLMAAVLVDGCGGGGGTSTPVKPTPPAPTTGVVTGTVLDSTGRGLLDAIVVASSPQAPSTITGTDGSWYIELPKGDFSVAVSKQGLSHAVISGTVPAGGTVATSPVMLVPTTGAPGTGAAPVVGTPTASPTTLTMNGQVTISASVSDADTPASGLAVKAVLKGTNRNVIFGPVNLTVAADGTTFTGSIPVLNDSLTGDDLSLALLVTATDTTGSGQSVTAMAPTQIVVHPATFTAPPGLPF